MSKQEFFRFLFKSLKMQHSKLFSSKNNSRERPKDELNEIKYIIKDCIQP